METQRYTNFSAWTSKPNTEESDGEMFVAHTVSYLDNGVKKVMHVLAVDPMDAIDSVHELLTNQ